MSHHDDGEALYRNQGRIVRRLPLARRDFLGHGTKIVTGAMLGGGLLNLLGCDAQGLLYNESRDSRAAAFSGCSDTVSPTGGDDTSTIQSAIDSVYQSIISGQCTSGVVWLESGKTYKYGTADITVRPDVVLAGPSSGSLPRLELLSGESGRINMDTRATLEYVHCYGAGNTTGQVMPCVNSWNTERWTVENCIIENYRGAGVNTGNDGFGAGVRDNIIRNNGDAGIQIGKGYHGCEFFRNDVINNGYNGIDCNGYNNNISGNDCRDNGWAGHATDKNGILVAHVGTNIDDNVVQNNKCSGNNRCGIFVEGPSDGTVINGNEVWDNTESGIMVEAGSDTLTVIAKIRSNTSYDNGWYGYYENQFGTPKGEVLIQEFKYNSATNNGMGCWLLEHSPDGTNICNP